MDCEVLAEQRPALIMMMTSLPLTTSLAILFEPSSILSLVLEPQLSSLLESQPPPSYARLVDLSLDIIGKWDIPSQSEFISGHPRIGESKNLSTLSAQEQGATAMTDPTPPEVLERLRHLNACYEAQYPGLRYITFVNGRSRAAIAQEMEIVLGIQHSHLPDTPPVDGFKLKAYDQSDERWLAELKRAVDDVGKIARSRLRTLSEQVV